MFEGVSVVDTGEAMRRRVFERFGLTRTSMTWRPDFAGELADGYTIDGTFEPHDERSRASAAGWMDMTIADRAKLWAAFVRGGGLSSASRTELFRASLPDRLGIAVSDARRADRSALRADRPSHSDGLITIRDAIGPMRFNGGHNDSAGNMAVLCQASHQWSVLLLSNSVRAKLIWPELVEFILGPTSMPRWREYVTS